MTSVTPFLLLPVHPEGCTPAHHMDVLHPLSAGVVLLDCHKQLFEVCNSLLVPGKLLFQDCQFFGAFHPKLLLHDLAEVVLMAKDVVRHLLNMVQHTTFQNLYPDEVSLALAPALPTCSKSSLALGLFPR